MQNPTINPMINQKPRPIKLSTVMALNNEDHVIVGPTTIETADENEIPTDSTPLNTPSDLANNMKVIDKTNGDFKDISNAWKRMTPEEEEGIFRKIPKVAYRGASTVGQGIGQGASYLGQGISNVASGVGSLFYPTSQSSTLNAQPAPLNDQPDPLNAQPLEVTPKPPAQSGGKSRKQMKRKSNKRAHRNKRVTRKQRAMKKQTVSTKKI
jgi:hypothetical protein